MYLWDHFLTRSGLSMKSAARSLEQASPKMTIWSNQLTHPDHIHFMDKLETPQKNEKHCEIMFSGTSM